MKNLQAVHQGAGVVAGLECHGGLSGHMVGRDILLVGNDEKAGGIGTVGLDVPLEDIHVVDFGAQLGSDRRTVHTVTRGHCLGSTGGVVGRHRTDVLRLQVGLALLERVGVGKCLPDLIEAGAFPGQQGVPHGQIGFGNNEQVVGKEKIVVLDPRCRQWYSPRE